MPATAQSSAARTMTLEADPRCRRRGAQSCDLSSNHFKAAKAINANRLVGGVCELLRRMVGESERRVCDLR
jgi:hypothetical protein